MGGCLEFLNHVDGSTVQELQSRVPKISNKDLKYLERKMNEGALFPKVQDPRHRNSIWSQLQMIDIPIPTLDSLFKNLHYLQVGRDVMRHLFFPDPERKVSIDEGVGEQYRGTESMSILTKQKLIRRGLHELWRFSLQYGFEMTNHRRRVPRNQGILKNNAFPSLTSEPSSIDRQLLWSHFLWLADHQGFTIPPPLGIQLQRANLPEPVPYDHPEEHGEDEPLIRRCGLPYTDSMDADRYALDGQMLGRACELRRVTVRLVRQAFFQAFFGHLREDTGGDPSVRTETSSTEYQATSSPRSIQMDDLRGENIGTPQAPPMPADDQISFLDTVSPFSIPYNGQESQSDYLQRSYFPLQVIFPDQPMRSLVLPNSLNNPEILTMLNEFFGELHNRGFHFRDASSKRGIYWVNYYDFYVRDPSAILEVTYPESPGSSRWAPANPGKRRRRESTEHPTIELNNWITQTVSRFQQHSSLPVEVGTGQVSERQKNGPFPAEAASSDHGSESEETL